jgi:sec-independent protein translocase protein TatB
VLDPTKLIIIAVVAFLFFGPDKLPEIARTVGRFMREFKKVQEEMETTLRSEMYKVDMTSTVGAPVEAPATASDAAAGTEVVATSTTAVGGWEHEDPDEEDEE